MEKDDELKLYINAMEENKKNDLIDVAVLNFNQEYYKVYNGAINKATLFAGDDNITNPRSIILLRKPELITVEYTRLIGHFVEIFRDDVIGDPLTFKIKKSAPLLESETTLLLSEFVKQNKNKDHEKLDVIQTRYNLRPTHEGSDVSMIIDLYLMPETNRNIPISEIWTLRKYQRNTINQDNK